MRADESSMDREREREMWNSINDCPCMSISRNGFAIASDDGQYMRWIVNDSLWLQWNAVNGFSVYFEIFRLKFFYFF